MNLASQGTIAVSIFSTPEFNAALVDVASVRFAGASAASYALADVDGDSDLDLVLHFRTQDTQLQDIYERLLIDDADENGILDSTHQKATVALTGSTSDEELFEGFDTLDLFLSGKHLRSLLEDLAANGLL